MDIRVFTRQEIYDLVWSEPMVSISKKYIISDVGLRKMCIRMNIPIPAMGHWQKVKRGSKIKAKALPTVFNGSKEAKLAIRTEQTPVVDPVKQLKNEILKDTKLNLIVPSQLSNPDPLIIQSKTILVKSGTFDGLVSCGWEALNIRVSPENVERALRFMDTFIKLLTSRGHSLQLLNHNTYIIIETEKISIKFREKLRREAPLDKHGTGKLLPSGIIYLKMEGYHDKEWIDGQLKIEDRLAEILAKFEIEGKRKHEERLDREKHWAEEAEKKQRQKELMELQDSELAKFKKLLGKASRYDQAIKLRNYIEMAELKGQNGDINQNELQVWLEWARKKADWYDPFLELGDDLLREVDKDELVFKRPK